MKKVATALGLTVLGICGIVAAYYCHFRYQLHKNTESRWKLDLDVLESRLKTFEEQVKRLEERKVRNLTPFHLSCYISTTDQTSYWDSATNSSDTNTIFKAWHGKGSGISPDFRLPSGNTNEFEFKIHLTPDFGKPVDAWLSQTDVSAFERFDVYRAFHAGETNSLKLVAKLRPDSSVKMHFDIVVLCLD